MREESIWGMHGECNCLIPMYVLSRSLPVHRIVQMYLSINVCLHQTLSSIFSVKFPCKTKEKQMIYVFLNLYVGATRDYILLK